MAAHSHIQIFMTILVVATVVQSKTDNVSHASFVAYQKLENALLTDQKLLYLLRGALFPSQGLNRGDCRHSCWLDLHVCVRVASLQTGKCNHSTLSCNFTYCQTFRWSSSALVDLILNDQLFVLDNVVSEFIFHLMQRRDYINVPLEIDDLPCDTTGDDLLAALMKLLPWVKSFAKLNNKPNENDKGYVSISYNIFVTELYKDSSVQYYQLTLFCAFIFLSILTPFVLAKFLSLYYSTIRERITGDRMGCLYCMTAIVAFLCNTAYITASLMHQFIHGHPTITPCIIHLDNYNCSIPSDTKIYRAEILTLVAKVIIIPTTVFMELVVSFYFVIAYQVGQKRPGYVGQRRPGCVFMWKQCFHVLALWNVLIAVQLLTMIAIPISVLLLIRPQVTIIVSLFIVMVPVVFTLLIAYLCRERRRRVCCSPSHCVKTFVHTVLITAILGLIIALLIIYEVILLVQPQIGTGVIGLVLSLLPFLPLPALGWCLMRRCQRIVMNVPRHELLNEDSTIDQEPSPP